MIRPRKAVALIAVLITASSLSLRADVKTDEKSHVEFAGMLGRMMNLFGGKSAREGVTSTVAVKGDRKSTYGDNTGQIIDLQEEKVYDLDMRHKTYKVTTFDQLRQQMQEAQRKAEESAKKQSGKPEAQPQQQQEPQQQMQVDVDVKNTGATKTINGFDTHEVVTTITMHEKGKTIDESGGMILTSDAWLAPAIPQMKEIADFDRRYAEKLYGPTIAGASADQMAAAMAMYPLLKDALGRMSTEGAKLDGTPIQSTVTIDSVKSADEMAQEKKQSEQDDSVKPAGGLGGMFGGFAKRAIKKKEGGDTPQARATFMTVTNEVLKVATSVDAADLAVPAGFKENK
jgi:hypothetical protein